MQVGWSDERKDQYLSVILRLKEILILLYYHNRGWRLRELKVAFMVVSISRPLKGHRYSMQGVDLFFICVMLVDLIR